VKKLMIAAIAALVIAGTATAGRPHLAAGPTCTVANCAESTCAVVDSGFPYICELDVTIPAATSILGAQWNWSPVHMKDRNWIWFVAPDQTRYCQFSYFPGLGNTSCGVSNPSPGVWKIFFQSSDTKVVVHTYATWS